ncbi:MAG: ATP-dependent DNA helicase RecG [Lachnospiraceae bacterium]|nr:ATP-dependent DNA helicase RecG [Lachnospiraceae bacterium]
MSGDADRSAYLNEPLTGLKGIGEKTAALFHGIGVRTVGGLLQYYPRDYEVFDEIQTVSQASCGTVCALKLCLTGEVSLRRVRRLTILSAEGADETGGVRITWFNAPWLKNALKSGKTAVFRGMLTRKGNTKLLQQPRVYAEDAYDALSGSFLPRYPLTKGLTNQTLAKAVRQALEYVCYLNDPLPPEITDREGFYDLKRAVRAIHFPRNEEDFLAARRRLAFDEFYFFIKRLRALKEGGEQSENAFPMLETANTRRLAERLPYRLTAAQERVWSEIRGDLTGPYVMNRLIQGDVGSGKTIVAFLALLMCASNGYQGAIMAPTSVLAAQHFEAFRDLAKTYALPVRPVLLTGTLTAKNRREAYAGIADGTYNLIVGTHALIQEAVVYNSLALVVTDEQHRFGVRARDALAGKGASVHVLAMSATPIPRTLAIVLYGDLHVSLLDEVPATRRAVKNGVVDASYREKAWQLIVKEARRGRQSYVICPMIEPGELEGACNVTEYTETMREALPESIRIGMLHGKMKAADKDRVMEDFAAGNIDVLVSTTVIEVGVNVPNATVMLIEDAQRFGLAQLHQLRGRVGRGDAQAYCIFTDTSGKEGNDRLNIMKESNDGFKIAEEDLRQRGPGELFGLRQSGALAFRIADIYRDADLLTMAAAYADRDNC